MQLDEVDLAAEFLRVRQEELINPILGFARRMPIELTLELVLVV